MYDSGTWNWREKRKKLETVQHNNNNEIEHPRIDKKK